MSTTRFEPAAFMLAPIIISLAAQHKAQNSHYFAPVSPCKVLAFSQPILIQLLPCWHQLVGMKKMANNMVEHKNVLLIDLVSIGKTI